MTGSGKTVWIQSLLQQNVNGSKRKIPDTGEDALVLFVVATRLRELFNTVPKIEFIKGIPENLEQDSYSHVNNLITIDDQMIEAGNDNRIVNLLTFQKSPV